MSDRVLIFDTTLRDGEQTPGVSMSIDEKVKIATVLERMGVDIIEAGFPAASPGDFDAVSSVASVVKNSVVCGLARAVENDVRHCGEAVKKAAQGRIHTFISTSPIHIEYQLKSTPEKVYEDVVSSVTLARSLCDNVEWSCMDASRSDFDFVRSCVEAAIKCGATTINIPDTVGYATPEEWYDLFSRIIETVPNSDKAIFSTHCHNDLGMATANSLAAVKAGARQIECTINGIGERAGNTSLEEAVMALRTRKDDYGVDTNIDAKMIMQASRLVSSITGINVQPNKAIVGQNAFAHESGIHQDGMLKHPETYEIMRPEDVGQGETKLVLGKLSGRNAFFNKIKDLGYDLPEEKRQSLFKRFKVLADNKKRVFEEDIIALIEDETNALDPVIVFKDLEMVWSKNIRKIVLSVTKEGTEIKVTVDDPDGPVDGIFEAVRELYDTPHNLINYKVNAVTEGKDSQAGIFVQIKEDNFKVNGQSADQNTLIASAKAYINAVNRLIHIKKRKGYDGTVKKIAHAV